MGDATERELIHQAAKLIARATSIVGSKTGRQFWADALKEYERITKTGEP